MSDLLAKTTAFRVIITGERGVGKSTLVNHLLTYIAQPIAGFRTVPIYEQGIKRGYAFQPWQEEAIKFIHLDQDGRVDQIDLEPFESIGCTVLCSALKSGNFIVMDELGLFEQEATDFCRLVKAILRQPRDFLVVIQQRALDFWLSDVDLKSIIVYTLTRDNRNHIYEQLAGKLMGR